MALSAVAFFADDGSTGGGTSGSSIFVDVTGVVAGDWLYTAVWIDNTGAPTETVTDDKNAGNYTARGNSVVDGNGQRFTTWDMVATGSGTTRITAALSVATVYKAIACIKISGASAFDVAANQNDQATPTTAANAVTSLGATNTAQPAGVFSFSVTTNTTPPAIGSGMTDLGTGWFTSQGFGARAAWKRVTSTGSQTSTFTAAANVQHQTSVSIYDEAGGGGGTSPPFDGAAQRQLRQNAIYRMSPRSEREAQQYLRAQKRSFGFAVAA